MPGSEWMWQGSGRCLAPRLPGASPFPSRFRRKRRPKRQPSRVAAAARTATYDAQIHDAIHALGGNRYTAQTCSTPNRARTAAPGHATTLARDLVDAGCDLLIIARGDGSLNVVNGILAELVTDQFSPRVL